MVEKLQKLFAMSVCYRHNLHMLHWKVKGPEFDCVHKLLDDYVGKFNEFIDEIAEMLLSFDSYPLTLQECLDLLSKDSDDVLVVESDEDYDSEEVFKAIGIMFDGLYNLYTEIRQDKSTDEYSECGGKLDEHKYWLRLENNYKNKRRMKD